MSPFANGHVQMLRITNFSDTQELLLRPNSNGNFYGYIRPKGVIENIALSQFHKFVNTKQLVRHPHSLYNLAQPNLPQALIARTTTVICS